MEITAAFATSARLIAESGEAMAAPLRAAIDLCLESLANGGTLYACGNGGSAADAQHFAAEIVGRFQAERPALPAVALTTDTSALTAIANDYGYEQVFARQLDGLARKGDVLLAISTSGNSANVVEAASRGRARGLRVIALTGAGGGLLAAHSDVLLAVPATVTARIQEVHAVCIHVLAEAIESQALDQAPGASGASGASRARASLQS